MSLCKHCGRLKIKVPNASRKCGYEWACRLCKSAHAMQWGREHRERRIEIQRAYRERQREQAA